MKVKSTLGVDESYIKKKKFSIDTFHRNFFSENLEIPENIDFKYSKFFVTLCILANIGMCLGFALGNYVYLSKKNRS